jgi:hypothetical protein
MQSFFEIVYEPVPNRARAGIVKSSLQLPDDRLYVSANDNQKTKNIIGEKKMIMKTGAAVSVLFLVGCSAISTTPEGRSVELLTEKPTGNCKPLGDVVGSQGNWFTGDYTSNKNLLIGARNDLRNKASKMGGNYVWVQDSSNTNAWGSKGTSNTTVLGVVYRCE